MTNTWTLRGTGRRPSDEWVALHRQTNDWTAAWADVSGFQLQAMPPQRPTTTHLWAWSRHQWLRVRIDHQHWWAALLTEGDIDVDPEMWRSEEPVPNTTVHRIRNWHNEREAKQFKGSTLLTGEEGHVEFVQLVPLRPMTAVFIGDPTTTESISS